MRSPALPALLAACTPHPAAPTPAAQPPPRDFALELPPSLAEQRGWYKGELEAAQAAVRRWFGDAGLALSDEPLLTRAVVFEGVEPARSAVAEHFGVPLEQVLPTFAGTVDGSTLFVVAEPAYQGLFTSLYPDETWTERTFRQLVTHEIAHTAHARVATALHGSEEGMGPQWFFEGIAIACAGQFQGRPPLAWEAFQERVVQAEQKGLSYASYAELIHTALARFPVRDLVARAPEPTFLAFLEEGLSQ